MNCYHLIVSFMLFPSACTSESAMQFAGKTKRVLPVPQAAEQSVARATATATPSPIKPLPTALPVLNVPEETPRPKQETTFSSGIIEMRSDLNPGEMWIVTGDKALRIEIDESRGYPVQTFPIPYNWGNRTYVSEIGLLLGRTNRACKVGESCNGLARLTVDGEYQTILSAGELNMAPDSRMCVTSFLKEGKPYIGAAYTAESTPIPDDKKHAVFLQIPIDKSQPKGVNLSQKKIIEVGNTFWGYSCYIDQSHNRFWSRQNGFFGINLNTETPIATAASIGSNLPNKNFADNMSLLESSPGAGNYAIAGDTQGNLLTGSVKELAPDKNRLATIYTMSADLRHNVVYTTTSSPSTSIKPLYITRTECFSTDTKCNESGKQVRIDVSDIVGGGAFLGPISALRRGGAVALTRGLSPNIAYHITPKNPNDLNQGVTFRKIATVPGDPYMYTDFTGATLYAPHVETTLDLTKTGGFVSGAPLVSPEIRWTSESGESEPLQGVVLKYRCYRKVAGTKPTWSEFLNPPAAGVFAPLPCVGIFDSVDLSIDGTGSSRFSSTRGFEIKGRQ